MNIPWTAYDEEFYAGLEEFFKKKEFFCWGHGNCLKRMSLMFSLNFQ